MNLLKKINTSLLENYPLLWHSKVIQLTFAGIICWILSYIVGFGLINLKTLQQFRIQNFYSNSGYIYFHITYEIIILSIWAIYFYKNNAFKSFYPLKKGYFIFLFGTLFFAFFILSSAYLPFTYGCKIKSKTLFDEKNIQQDIDKLNLGNAFLITSPNQYTIDNRSYPAPYPVDLIKYDENNKGWDQIPYDIIIPKSDTLNQNKETFWTNSKINEKNTIIIEGRKIQFYSTHIKYAQLNECDGTYNTYLTKIYKLDELDHPELNSIINFSQVLIEAPYRSAENGKLLSSKNKKYTSQIYQLLHNKNPKEVQKSIDNFVEVCLKYKIDNNINSKHLTRYLSYKKYKNFHHSIIHDWKNNSRYYNHQKEIKNIESSVSDTNKFIKRMSKQHVYFYSKTGLDSLIRNHTYLVLDKNNSYDLLFFLIISFSITWGFIWFEFASIKSLLITIPVAGIILIINVMIIVFSNFREQGVMVTFIITFIIIISLTLLGLKKKIVNKKVLNILMNLCYIIAPIFIMIIIILYNELTKHAYVQTKCNGIELQTHQSMFVEPYLFFIYSVMGLLLFIPLLKKWKALEE